MAARPVAVVLLAITSFMRRPDRAHGWRCSGCPADPGCSGTCPSCDPVCAHGKCIENQCSCDPVLGVGGCSGGGATSRALADYPTEQRNQILDYLFKPNTAQSVQLLKVEIGGDTQSTEGTEASHMRGPGDGISEEAFNRGYETWLLAEAKRRNPDIVTMGLSWGVPGWIGNGSTSDNPGRNSTLFFTDDNILYHVRWAIGLKRWYNISLDWMGVWNESPFDPDWIVRLRRALDAALPAGDAARLRIVAADNVRWGDNRSSYPGADGTICDYCLRNSTVRAAVGAIGTHYDWDGAAAESCQRLRAEHGIPLMVSEGHQGAHLQAYVGGNVTGYGNWPLFDGYFPVLPYSQAGPGSTGATAREPWSGHWTPNTMGARDAAFTQFSSPAPSAGCRYLENAAVASHGRLDPSCDMTREQCDIAVAISCVDPAFGKTILIESASAQGITVIPVNVSGAANWALWVACQSSQGDPRNWLQKVESFRGGSPIAFEAGVVGNCSSSQSPTYVLTTGTKGGWVVPPNSTIPPSAPLALPYSDDFASAYPRVGGRNLKYFVAEAGSFEAANSSDGHGVMRQAVDKRPIEWEHNAEPFALMGDNRWPVWSRGRLLFNWTDYAVTVTSRVAAPSLYPAGPVSTANHSRIVKAVAGWQTGPTGVTPDQPAGTGGGGQKAVAGGCVQRSGCYVGAAVNFGANSWCDSMIDKGTGELTTKSNTVWRVGLAGEGTLSCKQYNGTELCITVGADRLRNVSMQPCAAALAARQAWNLAALDPSSAAARAANSALQLIAGGCAVGTRTDGGHGYANWIEPCNSSGWAALDGTDANEGPYFRVTHDDPRFTPHDQTFVRVCGRIGNYQRMGQPPLGYCLIADSAGAWYLSAGGTASPQREMLRYIARGTLRSTTSAKMSRGDWVELSLSFKGSKLTAAIDGVAVVRELEDRLSPNGMIALGSGWHLAEFRNFSVVPV